jgi:hypothetical protein
MVRVYHKISSVDTIGCDVVERVVLNTVEYGSAA